MNPRTTIILLLVALGFGSWLFFVDRKGETTKQREEAARKALRIEQARVTGFTFTAGRNLTVTCAKQHDKWRLTAPVAARADAGAVDRLLGGLVDMKRGEVITEQDRAQRNTKLADMGWRLRVTASRSTLAGASRRCSSAAARRWATRSTSRMPTAAMSSRPAPR